MRNLGNGAFEQEDALFTGGVIFNAVFAVIDLKGDGHLSVVTPDPVSGDDAVLLFTNTTQQVCGYAVSPLNISFQSRAREPRGP